MKLDLSTEPFSGVKIWNCKEFSDERGILNKSFDNELNVNLDFKVVESFTTISRKNVFRGIHLQIGKHSSRKIIYLIQGSIDDVLVDLRRDSSSYGRIFKLDINESQRRAVFIPVGIGHGYLSKQNNTIVGYLMDNEFCRVCDLGVNPKLALQHLTFDEYPIISSKDNDLEHFLFEGKQAEH
jgi:dTDP-4-dehydrorhamnose 3,5-epimerase